MNESKKQHQLGVTLLQQLGLDYVRLERIHDGYRYFAWDVPLTSGNGSPRKSSRGTIRQRQIR